MSARARVVVAGLGPAGPELVTAATLRAIERIPRRYLRTNRHPAAVVAADCPSFDHHYERADDFDATYHAIVADLVAAAEGHGEVLYLVPGSPRVLERSVDLLAADARVEVDVLPALSFVDLAWARLGVDPFEVGARLIDGHRFAERAAGERGPLLVAHCHNQRVLSDIKLTYDDETPPSVTVLQRLGLPDERIVELDWADLDRAVQADHLTALWIPSTAPELGAEAVRFDRLVRTLRAECPWDRQQTHTSLARHLLEEVYEVLESIDQLAAADPDADLADANLAEELGDLLFQVSFHSLLAEERGAFTLADVTRGIHDKLHARHPHVFGGDAPTTTEQLAVDWEQRKVAEKGRVSVMDGIPAALPALLYALKVQKKAASQGVDWRRLAADAGVDESSLAGRLLALVDESCDADADADPETELRRAVTAIRDAYAAAAGGAGGRGSAGAPRPAVDPASPVDRQQ